jgi:hypothetical protein
MDTLRAIAWEAPEHNHIEKGSDWFFALGIIVLALIVVAILFNNTLLALLIGVAGGVMAVSASKRPSIIPFAVTVRGVRVGDRLYPYSTLRSYHINEEDPRGPRLLLHSKRWFMPLLVLPVPEACLDDIEDILCEKLPEEYLEESLFMKVLELLGF